MGRFNRIMTRTGSVSCFAVAFILASFNFNSRADVMDITVGSLGPACAICNGMLEGKLKHVPGIEKVTSNLKDSTFTLVSKPGQPLDVAAMKKAVNDSGYAFKYIQLTMKGMFTDSAGNPAFKEPSSGQVFQLTKGESGPIAPEKLAEIKTMSDNGVKPIKITGMAYPGSSMDMLAPTEVATGQ